MFVRLLNRVSCLYDLCLTSSKHSCESQRAVSSLFIAAFKEHKHLDSSSFLFDPHL